MLFFCSEFVYCLLLVLFARLEYDRREVGAVGRVGEVLRFKTYCAAAWERSSVLALVAVGPVVGVELYARFCCVNFHHAAAYGFGHACREAKLAFLLLVENITMVVARAVAYLLVVGVDVAAYGFG